MPFTLSHPAAVLPLGRFASHPAFVLAMVIGSIAPDAGYYLRVFSWATFAHTLAGSALVCIPAGLVIFAGILLVRGPLLWLLPSRIRLALEDALIIPTQYRTGFLIRISLFLWLGALTHIFWDAFTHRTGWFVLHSRFLESEIAIGKGLSLPVYYILQQTSTLLGFSVVVFFAYRTLGKFQPKTEDRGADLVRYCLWAGLLLASMAIAVPFALIHSSGHHGLLGFRTFVFQLAIISGSLFACMSLGAMAAQ